MKNDKSKVIQVDFANKGQEQDEGIFIEEFNELLGVSSNEIDLEGFSCDYEAFIERDFQVSLAAYYQNVAEEKVALEKIIEREAGVVWHYINNANGLLKVTDFYNIKEKINDRFSFAGIELDRALEIEGFIVLVFKECEIDEDDFFDEASVICTVEEMKEYFNKEIFNNLSEERQKYLRNIFEDTEK
ncbi:hypothetical protein P4604_20285 [Lysinibacillus capsici]|uniref:hypothetical protein n=1 Tax=Lysinibacillus capsici TaxID=2115968 RepID=UPI002E1DCD8D|nr:hypothetical protein [Lysinibacillus capsici]